MYCVHWKTRKARLARKSRADSRPATGRSWNPVFSETAHTLCARCTAHGLLLPALGAKGLHQPILSAPTRNSTYSALQVLI